MCLSGAAQVRPRLRDRIASRSRPGVGGPGDHDERRKDHGRPWSMSRPIVDMPWNVYPRYMSCRDFSAAAPPLRRTWSPFARAGRRPGRLASAHARDPAVHRRSAASGAVRAGRRSRPEPLCIPPAAVPGGYSVAGFVCLMSRMANEGRCVGRCWHNPDPSDTMNARFRVAWNVVNRTYNTVRRR